MSQLELNTITENSRKTFFVDVLLPVPIPKMFTYRVPFELNDAIKVGCRVIVQFGARKVLTGVIGKIHETAPIKYEAKYILELLDLTPILPTGHLGLFQWIADYYMCSVGEVFNIALPSGLKLSSESKVQLYPGYDYEDPEKALSDKEYNLLKALKSNETLSYQEISQLLGIKSIYAIIKSLVQKEAIILFEEVKEKYRPKIEKRIRLAPSLVSSEEALAATFKSLEKKPKQTDILLKYMQEVSFSDPGDSNEKGIIKSFVKAAGMSTSSLNTLIKNKVFEEFEVNISRFGEMVTPDNVDIKLTEQQYAAKAKIFDAFETTGKVLLHGITGSGKTEIYIDLIKNALDSGSQALYLLPEIALTTQIVSRLSRVFGSSMGVYHSKFSDNERVEVWRGLTEGRFSFVVGVRSAIFLPFDNLGLIIVDEEHESSYKQYEPAPRYNARDVALFLAEKQHAKVLLGSATPSVESYYNAVQGKYTLVELKTRFGGAQLPDMVLADTIKEKQKKTMKADFTLVLLEALSNTLNQQEQAIIFQNRRGYSPHVTCEDCGWIPKCDSCAVSLTYHMYKNELRCHYCGFKQKIPITCEACGSTRIKTIGFGTEKLEEDLQLLLEDAKIKRMDLDTTRSKYSYQTIIDDFEKGNIDILVGTQMVSKGLDFDKVNLVGVFDADRMLHFPDFRSYERTFQLITQVSGRAGRREKKGLVVIQTANPKQPILNKIINNDYLSFYNQEVQERQVHLYPPFTRLIKIIVKNKDKSLCEETAKKLSNLLIPPLGKKRVLGPEEPVVSKIRNQYIMEILIKLERNKIDLKKVKTILRQQALELLGDKRVKNSRIIFDVDPY